MGNICVRNMTAGVPQGSVLGPLLWLIAYDTVVRSRLPYDARNLCYADDMAILLRGVDSEELVGRAQVAAMRIITQIERLGLAIALQKTEAVAFTDSRQHPRVEDLTIVGEVVRITEAMKYLGVVLDRRLTFKKHLLTVEGKAAGPVAFDAEPTRPG